MHPGQLRTHVVPSGCLHAGRSRRRKRNPRALNTHTHTHRRLTEHTQASRGAESLTYACARAGLVLSRAKAPREAAAQGGNESWSSAVANQSAPSTQRGWMRLGKLKPPELKPPVLPQLQADQADQARLPSVAPSVAVSSVGGSLVAWLPAWLIVVVGLGVVAAGVRMWWRRSVFWDAINQKSPKLSGMRRNDSVYASFAPLLLLSCSSLAPCGSLLSAALELASAPVARAPGRGTDTRGCTRARQVVNHRAAAQQQRLQLVRLSLFLPRPQHRGASPPAHPRLRTPPPWSRGSERKREAAKSSES